MRRIITFIWILITFAVTASGAQQSEYTFKHFEDAAQRLEIMNIDSLKNGNNIINVKGYDVIIRKENDGKVTHIGICLFSQEMRNQNPLPVYDFLEYACLDNIFHISDNSLKYIDIKFHHGTWKELAQVKPSTPCNISIIDEKMYNVEWALRSNKTVSLSMPIKYDLLKGATRTDVIDGFIKELRNYKVVLEKNATFKSDKLIQDSAASYKFYTLKGKTYIDKSICSDTYYVCEQENFYVPLIDKGLPEQTMANIMCIKSNQYVGDYPLNLKIIKGGEKVEELTVTIRQLIDYAIEQGCTPYFGIEKNENNTFEASLFLHNVKSGYNHIIAMSCESSLIGTRNLTINARGYLFAPTTNIRDMFLERKYPKATNSIKKQ